MKHLNLLVTRWRELPDQGFVIRMAKLLDAALWIKAYDGARWLNLGQPLAVIAHWIQQQGVDVGAWGYHYGGLGEAERLLECAFYRHNLPGYEGPRAGLLIDAESEFERTEGWAAARGQVDRIVAAPIEVPVYYTSFAFPSLHGPFPYSVFNRLSGGHVPQVYYNHAGWPEPAPAVLQSVAEHKKRGLALTGVMLPIYDAGPEQGWRPTPEHFHQATLAARIADVPSVWTWSLEYHDWRDWLALWHYSLLHRSMSTQ